jgi:toxin ParE1/3/4
MRIDYHPAVAEDPEAVRDFYEGQSEGLGRAFVDEFEAQILRIASMPERWMIVERDLRRALMRRFPYVIYFRCPTHTILRVTLVKHEKRHPRFGMERA